MVTRPSLTPSVCLSLLAVSVFADVPSFDRYQVILDRKPFGALPPPEVNLPPTPAPDSFAKNLRLTMIIEPDDGPKKIGFIDGRTNRSYTLAEGESADGIEVVSADFVNEQAILKQGSEMALIKFSSGEAVAISPDQAQNRPAPQPAGQDYVARRQMRRQQEQPQPPPEPVKPKYTGAELEKHLYEYQMEVIRQGLPPLPIPLTPEQDAQLVREGVLPPQ